MTAYDPGMDVEAFDELLTHCQRRWLGVSLFAKVTDRLTAIADSGRGNPNGAGRSRGWQLPGLSLIPQETYT